jgi:hypothetical protein
MTTLKPPAPIPRVHKPEPAIAMRRQIATFGSRLINQVIIVTDVGT